MMARFFFGLLTLFVAISLLLAADRGLPPGVKDTQAAKDQPPSPEQAVKMFKIPDGFKVTLFAGEPDVCQPIAMAFDDRGRLWVAECFSYPDWKPEGQDRILIFEDTDGDGKFDKRTVFMDKLANLTGIEMGYGGVWACCAPNLLFIPDKDGNDLPDGKPETMLDGWSTKIKHNIVNGLTWGPDGWLYGCHGILSESRPGPPGTPEKDRPRINCGIWKFHPVRKTFEVVCHGTTNPWGLDFDEHGEGFFTNCVIGHLWHMIPGAHYKRMYGQDYNPYCYELIDATSDHLHWGGGDWTTSRGGKGTHSDAGGGHAHSGAMIYLGDNWPDEYRGQIFMCNIHGNRLNRNKLERTGCGYVGRRAPDILLSDNDWFRGVCLTYGPDGGVYIADWCDHGECHDDDGVHRSSGRIYKVMYTKKAMNQNEAVQAHGRRSVGMDLKKLPKRELMELRNSKNHWHVRHVERILAERHQLYPRLISGSLAEMRYLVDRIMYDPYKLSLSFAETAKRDQSGLVRLHLASCLQKLPLENRLLIAEALAQRAEDAEDRCQPLMIWYGIEPAVMQHKKEALELAEVSRIPKLRRFIARRLAEGEPGDENSGIEAVIGLLGRVDNDDVQLGLVRGLHDGLKGRKNLKAPPGWAAAETKLKASPRVTVQDAALLLGLRFDASGASSSLQELVANTKIATDRRSEAMQALAEKQIPELPTLLLQLLKDPAMRSHAIRTLAAYSNDETPGALLKLYGSLTTDEKQDAIATLASRPKFAFALLDAVERNDIPRTDVSTFTARQINDLGDKGLSERLVKVWGQLRQTSAEKKSLIAKYKSELPPDSLAKADIAKGRQVYKNTCAQCHLLHGEGAKIGPDLTGSNRTELHYILENVIDPSASVGRDYQLTNILTHNGRLIAGIITEETAKSVTVQTATEKLVVSKDDIDQRKAVPISMMPEGMLEKLSAAEIRDLVGYLMKR